jgi:hypothetical protein
MEPEGALPCSQVIAFRTFTFLSPLALKVGDLFSQCYISHFDDRGGRGESSVFWDLTPYSTVKSVDVSEKYIASIFRIEEKTKQETCKKQATRSAHPRRQNYS